MKFIAIAPFCIPFAINKDLIIAHNTEWKSRLNKFSALLSNTNINIEQGSYGVLPYRKILYGARSVNDQGAYISRYYVLKFSGELSDIFELNVNAINQEDRVYLSNIKWEIKFFNNYVATITLISDINFEKNKIFTKELTEVFYEQTNEFVQFLLNDKLHEQIDKVVNACNSVLKKNAHRKENNFEKIDSIYQPDSIFGYYNAPWVNRTILITNEECDRYTGENINDIGNLFLQEIIEKWIDGNKSIFGWGTNLTVQDNINIHHWIDALCIAQFYYASFEMININLPIKIANKYKEVKQTKTTINELEKLNNIRHEIEQTLIDYKDLSIRVSGDTKYVLKSLNESWEIDKLQGAIKSKIQILENLIRTSSDYINKKVNNLIQNILFFIGLISIVSFTTNLHWYLSPNNNIFLGQWFNDLVNNLPKDLLLLNSVVIVLITITIFIFAKRK